MQCPSCGFENMPGRQDCAVCSTQLSPSAQRESVMPPRARDRSVVEKVRWRIDNRQPLRVANRRVANARDNLLIRLGGARNGIQITWSWITPRNLWLLLISIIPGFGYIFGRRDKYTGISFFCGAIAALLVAIAAYRTYVADVLVWGVAATSVISVFVAAGSILPASPNRRLRYFSQAGITLLVISVICSIYFWVVFSGRFPISEATVLAQPYSDLVAMGDTILLYNGNISRGDVVIGSMVQRQNGIGVVVGVPGDWVQVSADGAAYLNGSPLQLPVPDQNIRVDGNSVQSYSDRVIPQGELLIVQTMMTTQHGYGLFDTAGEVRGTVTGYVKRERIMGRLVAVTWPPAHRKIVRSGHTNEPPM